MRKAEHEQTQRNLWDFPWGYVESFLIGLGLFLVGMGLQLITGNFPEQWLLFPVNLITFIGYVALFFIVYSKAGHTTLVRWFTGIPATLTVLGFIVFIVLIMGSIPQSPTENELINLLGLNHITSHWSFYILLFLLLTALGLISIKRALPFKKSNIGFLLNHVGLFIAIAGGFFGQADKKTIRLTLTEHQTKNWAYTVQNEPFPLGFGIKLNDFSLEEYPPKLAFVDNISGKVLHNEGKNLFIIEEKAKYPFQDFQIEIIQFLPSAGRVDQRYVGVQDIGTPPAAYLKITDTRHNTVKNAWISCGSFLYPFESYKINDSFSVVMTLPEVKKYQSDITIITPEKTTENIKIEVNKPYTYKGWKLYQSDYETQFGKWSNKSELELVKDPWLPVVYTGIFMMLAGAVYLFWKGKKF